MTRSHLHIAERPGPLAFVKCWPARETTSCGVPCVRNDISRAVDSYHNSYRQRSVGAGQIPPTARAAGHRRAASNLCEMKSRAWLHRPMATAFRSHDSVAFPRPADRQAACCLYCSVLAVAENKICLVVALHVRQSLHSLISLKLNYPATDFPLFITV